MSISYQKKPIYSATQSSSIVYIATDVLKYREELMKKNDIEKILELKDTLGRVENYMVSLTRRHSAFMYFMWTFVVLIGYGGWALIWSSTPFETVSESLKIVFSIMFYFGMAALLAFVGHRLFGPKYRYVETTTGEQETWQTKGRRFDRWMGTIWIVFGVWIFAGGFLLQSTYGTIAWAYVIYGGLSVAVFAIYILDSVIFGSWTRSLEHLIAAILLWILSPITFFESTGDIWWHFTYAISVSYLCAGLYALYAAEKYAILADA